jgi:hypothetical protein
VKAANHAIVGVILAGLAFCAESASADAYGRLAGAASYPAQAADFVDRVAALLDRTDALIDKADAVAGCRLEQARREATSALAGLKALEDKAFHDLITLETKFVSDLDEVINRRRRSP